MTGDTMRQLIAFPDDDSGQLSRPSVLDLVDKKQGLMHLGFSTFFGYFHS